MKLQNARIKKGRIEYQLILIFFSIVFAMPAYGATIYVDQTLGVDCTSGNYSTTNRTCTGSDGNAYITIQAAINAMSVGDTIYIRGGTYREDNGNSNADIYIPTSKNGTAWTDGNFNTLTSYPGEWAIIDGEGTAPGGNTIGNGDTNGVYQTCTDNNSTSEIKYWKFERLEITGGCSPNNDSLGGGGIRLRGGPNIIRYCYIHDNWDTESTTVPGRADDNPSGVLLFVPHDSIIEYNYFYHNGSYAMNGDQIKIFSDYKDEWRSSPPESCDPPNIDVINIDKAVRNNIIRYNYFNGDNGSTKTDVGLKYKSSQVLDSWDGSELTHKNYGDDVHHNIFVGHGQDSIGDEQNVILRQDYLQFHNNILRDSPLSQSQYGSYRRLRAVIYNNTVIGSGLESYDESSPAHAFQNWDFFYNNIIDNFTAGISSYPVRIFAESAASLTNVVNNLVMDRNYIYRPNAGGSTPYSIGYPLNGLDAKYGRLSTITFNSQYSATNYQKASSEGSDNLFSGSSGASAYITRGSHTVSGSTTITNGGIGGNHPYLSDVTIPSYIGATNPTDNGWVEDVMSFAEMTDGVPTNLQSGMPVDLDDGEPSQGDTTPPSTPSGLSVS